MPAEDMEVSENNSLIQFAISLSEQKTELDKSYFEQFIQPAWEAFEKIYSEYAESVKKNMEFLESEEFQYKTLLDEIQHGSLHVQRLRWEFIRGLAQIHHSEHHSESNWFDSVILFSLSVEEYLSYQGIIGTVFQVNCGRNDIKQMKKFLEDTQVDIQGLYQKAVNEYHKLSAFLIT